MRCVPKLEPSLLDFSSVFPSFDTEFHRFVLMLPDAVLFVVEWGNPWPDRFAFVSSASLSAFWTEACDCFQQSFNCRDYRIRFTESSMNNATIRGSDNVTFTWCLQKLFKLKKDLPDYDGLEVSICRTW